MTAQTAPIPALPSARPAAGRARLDADVRTLAGGLLWLSLLLVAYWWTADRGIQAFTSLSLGLTSAGRLTGLVASDLLLVQLVR